MNDIKVKLRWTYPAHVNVIKESCICNTSGIYQLSTIENGQETVIYVDTALNSYHESLEMLSELQWYHEIEKDLFIRIAFILYPLKWNPTIISEIQTSLIDQYHPQYNLIPERGMRLHENHINLCIW